MQENETHYIDVSPVGDLTAKPKPVDCRTGGPITTLYQQEGYWYWPPIKVRQCSGLSCPNNSPCLARKTSIRNVWAICYKRCVLALLQYQVPEFIVSIQVNKLFTLIPSSHALNSRV